MTRREAWMVQQRVNGNSYPVNNIYASVQGEGCLTGVPMVILRLHGCDVGCPFCDTKETWAFSPGSERDCIPDALGANGHFTYQSPSGINHYLRQHFPTLPWVLLTGGEPAQYTLKPLVAALHDGGYKVALETSGTETGHLGAKLDWVCISPKINMPGGKSLQPEAFEEVNEVKMVIGRERDLEVLTDLLSTYSIPKEATICLQPMSQTQRATQLCIQTCLQRGYRLSIQTHKLLSLP